MDWRLKCLELALGLLCEVKMINFVKS